MHRSRAIVAAASLLGLAACGSSSSGGSTTEPPKADVVITAIEGIKWDAPSYTVAATAGKVVVQSRNDSSLPHNLYIIGADGRENPSHADLPSKGKVVTETAELAPGSYTVICKIPGHNGMKSSLTVT